ncbi:hypothetical protein SB6413_05990 [Klebsiella pasteurii]|nr:hypothetical protein SB6413_05990 [Klebsiella pasteurii]
MGWHLRSVRQNIAPPVSAIHAEKARNNIAVCTRIGHYLVWYLIRLLLQNDSQDDQTILERSRNNDVVYPRILVRHQVVPCRVRLTLFQWW